MHIDEIEQAAAAGPVTPTERVRPLALESLPVGTVVGRYRVVQLLSIGGMGVVFKAYDPELSRHIALKVVQPSAIEIDRHRTPEEYDERLLREAQALARLSHPHVVAAFDVGRFEGALFIAMELIDGESLHAWLLGKHRPLRDVLSVLIDAGRGLSAAHRAGVVHRDFKLSNVMVSSQGRVQVVDFGLARTSGVVLDAPSSAAATESEGSFATEESSGVSLRSSDVTRTGAVIGTPGYIAPELFEGGSSDERSDQFSYASAAFRALTGRSVYAVDSLAEYRAALLRGDRAAWPRSVPRAVRKVIDRGLSRAPKDRYPTFDALLEDLERAARPPRRLRMLGIVAVGASALVSTLAMRERLTRRCDPDLEPLEIAWSGDRATRIESAFQRSGSARAGENLAVVRTKVAAFRDRWQAARQQACAATHQRHEQSEATLGLRNACLDSKLRQFGTLAELFERGDAATVDRAPEALDELTSLADCSDVLSLVRESDRLPEDPRQREPIAELQRRWDTLQVPFVTGRWSELLESGQALALDAERLGYKPIQARALSHSVMALERLGRPAEAGALRERTLQVAAEAGVHEVLAQQSIRMLRQNVDAERLSEAKAMLPLVDMSIGLAGRPAALQIRLLTYEAVILTQEGDYRGAIDHLERALAECRQLGSEGLRSCLTPQRELGQVYAARADYDAARPEFAKAIDLAKQAFGPRHPNVVNEYNNMTEIMLQAHDVDTAAKLIAESKALAASLPPDRQSANIPMLEGRLLAMRGDCRGAIPVLEEAVRRIAAVYGEKTVQATVPLHELGRCLTQLGETNAAVRVLEHALEIRRETRTSPNMIASSAFRLAGALWAVPDQRRRARQLAEEALALLQAPGQGTPQDLEEVNGWLSSHPLPSSD